MTPVREVERSRKANAHAAIPQVLSALNDSAHRESLDGIVPRARTVAHYDVFALPDDRIARLFQGANRIQVVDARNFWHGYSCTSTSRTSAPRTRSSRAARYS